MRVIVYGAGGIGGVVGGHLARTGHEVVLIGRCDLVQAINDRGFRLITPAGTYDLRLPAVTSPDQIHFVPDDVVFLCMKGQDSEEALRTLKEVTSDVPVFCLQNGVRNEEIAARYFPRVYGAMIRMGAVYLAPGEVVARRDPPGLLIIGRYPQGIDDLAEVVAAELRTAGFMVMTALEVMPYKWGKLMRNLDNAVGAITNASGEETAPITNAAQQELRDLLAKSDIRWASVSEEDLASKLPEITKPARGQIDNKAKGSTWQSLVRKTGTIETEFINGEVVRLGRRLGRQAPINEKLSSICLEMSKNQDLPGKYTPSQLRQLLGLD